MDTGVLSFAVWILLSVTLLPVSMGRPMISLLSVEDEAVFAAAMIVSFCMDAMAEDGWAFLNDDGIFPVVLLLKLLLLYRMRAVFACYL